MDMVFTIIHTVVGDFMLVLDMDGLAGVSTGTITDIGAAEDIDMVTAMVIVMEPDMGPEQDIEPATGLVKEIPTDLVITIQEMFITIEVTRV